MSEKAKPPWFRFRLLAAVVMMFAGAGLLYMNMTLWLYGGQGGVFTTYTKNYGWPFTAVIATPDFSYLEWMPLSLIVDVISSLLMIAVIGFVTEFLLRRREEPEKPKRRFWRYPISTAIVLVILAGIFIGINMLHGTTFETPETPKPLNPGSERIRPSEHWILREEKFGWPFTICEESSLAQKGRGDEIYERKDRSERWDYLAVIKNSLVLAILAAIGILLERASFRREVRKTNL